MARRRWLKIEKFERKKKEWKKEVEMEKEDEEKEEPRMVAMVTTTME